MGRGAGGRVCHPLQEAEVLKVWMLIPRGVLGKWLCVAVMYLETVGYGVQNRHGRIPFAYSLVIKQSQQLLDDKDGVCGCH